MNLPGIPMFTSVRHSQIAPGTHGDKEHQKPDPAAAGAARTLLLVLAVQFGFISAAFCDVQDTLLGYWNFDEGTGSTAHDASENGNHGRLILGTMSPGPLWEKGPPGLGGALRFQGDGYVEVPNNRVFDVTEAITIAAWIRVPQDGFTSDWQTIFCRGDWSWRLHRNSMQGMNNKSVSFHLTGMKEGWGADGSVTVTDNEWHHVAGTWDGARARIYFDGAVDDDQPRTGTIGVTGNDPVTIGAQIHNGELRRQFIGHIDDVRIYGRALSPKEIGELWSSAKDRESDSFYDETGKKTPVSIALDRLGAVAAAGATDKDIETFVAPLGLRLLAVTEPGRLVILGLEARMDRQPLVEFARDIRTMPDVPFVQVGLVLDVAGYKDPSILTDEFIAQFNPDVTKQQIEALNKRNAVETVMENPFVRNQFLLRVSKASKTDALTMANSYYESDLTKLAYPNFISVSYDQQTIPNDTLFGNQWHLDNTGQGGGTVDADADLPEAWDITMGDAGIIIAVLENGGFDMGHPDLTPNRWVNPGEDLNGNGVIDPAEINGVDDDGNGFIDDFYGWDFDGCTSAGSGCGDNDPSPANSTENHATAVAGVVGARGNNNLGVSGSCPNCRLMFLRKGYVSSDWTKSLAFGYAQQEGARIVTNSWGSSGAMPNTITAINTATAAGVVILFAAGNNNNLNVCSGANQDPLVSLPDVIAVSSSTNLDRKAVGGTYAGCSIGNCIDILAPSFHGDTGTTAITTTDRTGTDGYDSTDYTSSFSGTSSATPLTAGVVGLILSVNSTLTRLQVQQLLQDTADKIEDSVGHYSDTTGFSSPATGVATHSWGRLNAFEAVRIAAPVADGGKGGVDIFFRDNRLDWGNTEQPSNTLFESPRGYIGHWRSMDIKVDAPPYQTPPTALTFDAFVDETPSAVTGTVNRVYVRAHNRGPVTANSVSVKLHWTQFATALAALPNDFWTAFPANSTNTTQWHPLNCSGSSSPVCTLSNLAYSGSSVAGTAADAAQIAQFDFPAPTVSAGMPNHFCLLAMIDSPQDRILPKSRPTVPDDFVADVLTPTDNNVTHRNYMNLETDTSDSFAPRFFVRNPYPEPITAVLTLDAPEGWGIRLDERSFDVPFVLGAGKEVLVTAHIYLPAKNVTGEVTITQRRVDTKLPGVMGGVTFYLRPTPWRTPTCQLQLRGADIGGPQPPGSCVALSNDRFLVTAGGSDIWGSADQFHFGYIVDPKTSDAKWVTGDFTATVAVEPMDPSGPGHEWAKAGIMAREDLEPNSPHTMVIRTLKMGAAHQGRDTQGAESWHTPLGSAYNSNDRVWLRLDRVGNMFSGSYAVGGEFLPTIWLAAGSHEVQLPSALLLGLATTSHEQGVRIVVPYSDFCVGPYVGPPVIAGSDKP